MKLGPRQVRLITPFWPSPFGRTVRFTGRRNTVDLQETALVAEGEILLFQCFGLERLFGRALSAWSTVTVPYSRIVSVRYRRTVVLRLVILAMLAALLAVGLQLPRMKASEWTSLDVMADAIIFVPVVIVGCIVWWRIRPSYTFKFRLKDGKRRKFHFAIRSRVVKREFDDALMQYRQAAKTYAPTEAAR